MQSSALQQLVIKTSMKKNIATYATLPHKKNSVYKQNLVSSKGNEITEQ